MRFLVDAQLPPALARYLVELGHTAQHVHELAIGRVVWIRLGNCANRALIAWLSPLWPQVLVRLAAGDRLVEVV